MRDFLNNPDFRKELFLAAEKARLETQSLPKVNSVSLGDCFFFPESVELPVRWIVVLQHKDVPEMWYSIAVDEFPLIGSTDSELVSNDFDSTLALRCNVGFWIREEDIQFEMYLGNLGIAAVEMAQTRLSQMVHGDLVITNQYSPAEVDPDYKEWLSAIEEAAYKIETRVQSEPGVLRLSTFSTSWTRLPLVASRLTGSSSLAADSTGQNELTSKEPAPGMDLACGLAGKLIALKEEDELDLMYYAVNESDKPPSVVVQGSKDNRGRWVLGADGAFTWSQPLRFDNNKIEFSVGSDKFQILRE